MRPNWFIGEMRSGDRTQVLHPISGSYSRLLSVAGGELSCTVDMRSSDVTKLDLGTNAEEWKYYLAVERNGQIRQAGPILGQTFDDDKQQLKINAAGFGAYFARRVQVAWPIRALPTDTVTLRGSYGDIVRAVVRMTMQHPGGDLPIVIEQKTEGGDKIRVYNNFDLSWVGDLLDNLTNIIDGPDIVFRPRLRSDGLGIEWVLITGTVADDEVHSIDRDEQVWDHSARRTTVESLSIARMGSNLNDETYVLGGGQQDVVLMTRSSRRGLRDRGFPLLQHQLNLNSVSEIKTAQGYADRQTQFGQDSITTWSMKVRANQSPRVGSYAEGDYVRVRVGPGHHYIPAGEYRMRMLGFSSDETEDSVTLTLAPDRTQPDAGDATP